MKKEDVPQHISALGKLTTELYYVTDNKGNYTTEKSRGWDVKITALDVTWQDIEERMDAAKKKVLNNEASPLLFFMEKGLMDIGLLAGYSGFWRWQVRKHLKPANFKRLSGEKLRKYAEIFSVTINELQNMNVYEQ